MTEDEIRDMIEELVDRLYYTESNEERDALVDEINSLKSYL